MLLKELMALNESDKVAGRTFEQHLAKAERHNEDELDYEWKKSENYGEIKAWKLDDQGLVGTIIAKSDAYEHTILIHVEMELKLEEMDDDDDYGDEQWTVLTNKPNPPYFALDTSQWDEMLNEWM